jgi:hypothetical protein
MPLEDMLHQSKGGNHQEDMRLKKQGIQHKTEVKETSGLVMEHGKPRTALVEDSYSKSQVRRIIGKFFQDNESVQTPNVNKFNRRVSEYCWRAQVTFLIDILKTEKTDTKIIMDSRKSKTACYYKKVVWERRCYHCLLV